MRKLILFVILAVLLAPLAAWLADHPGTVRIEWLGTEVETTMGVLLLAALLLAASAALLFEFLRWLFGMPRRFRERRELRRLRQGYGALTKGLVAAAAGDVVSARHHTRRAEKLLGDSQPALLLLEAQAAQLEGDETEALRRFRAMVKDEKTRLLGLRGLLAHAMKEGDFDQALKLAREAYRLSPGTPWVVSTLFDLLTRAEQWEEALALLGQLLDLRIITRDQARHRRAVLHLLLARKARAAGRLQDALRHARRAIQLDPGFAPAAVEASHLARSIGRHRLARRLLERAWKRQPHPELVKAYLELAPDEPPDQRLRRLERLRSLQPFAPLSYRALAEAQMAAGNHQEARKLLERARELGGDTTGLCYLFAELERRQNGDPREIRRWLARATEVPADPAWVCEDTGEVLPEWRPFGLSGRFDAVQWSIPPKTARLARDQIPSHFLLHRPDLPSEGGAVVPSGERTPAEGREEPTVRDSSEEPAGSSETVGTGAAAGERSS